MYQDNKQYRLIKKCFVGDIGDIIVVDWAHYDGASWENVTAHTFGCPFIETDCIEPISDEEYLKATSKYQRR